MAIFTNQATLSYNGLTTNSNTVEGELVENLSIDKRALSSDYCTCPVIYILSLFNTRETAAENLTVSDDLGGYLYNGTTVYPLRYIEGSAKYYVNGTATATPTLSSQVPLEFTGISIPAGGNAMLIYAAAPTDYAPRESSTGITNMASVSAEGVVLASSDTTVLAMVGPNLSVIKSINPTQLRPGDTLQYTFLIENSGNVAATSADNLSVSDLFDPKMTNLSVTLNGVSLSLNTGYTYDSATGLFVTVPGVITVPAATYQRNQTTGAFVTTPGKAVLQVSGTI